MQDGRRRTQPVPAAFPHESRVENSNQMAGLRQRFKILRRYSPLGVAAATKSTNCCTPWRSSLVFSLKEIPIP